MAAGQAAAAGADTILLERTDRLGAKLRITGHGRCNLTNLAQPDLFLEHFASPDGTGNGSHLFLRNAFARFFAPELIAWLEGLGVPTVADGEGRVFPASHDARHVTEALACFARRKGVQIWLRSRAMGLDISGGRIQGLALEDGRRLPAMAVIVACGGASYPHTGSTGDGYLLAEQAGHRLVSIRPALVPLVLAGEELKAMMGVSLHGVETRLILDERELARASGDLLFTHYGVSGPLALSLSRAAVAWLGHGRLELALNLRPGLTPGELDARLRAEMGRTSRRSYGTLLRALLPDRMSGVVAARTGIAPGKPVNQITALERAQLRALLQDMCFQVTGHRPLAEAMVTAGGIDTSEVEPATMASRLVAGLYFAGEVLDVQADTGGYNLQAAFSTGYVAGRAAAGYVKTLDP
jgi:hypothetical protein